MTIDTINVETTVKRVKDLIAAEKDVSPALKASLEVLLLLVSILVNRLGLNSSNSSKPPSTDPNPARRRREPRPGGNQAASTAMREPRSGLLPIPMLSKVHPG